MMKWLATVAILALMALVVVAPSLSIGRRGNEALARADVPSATLAIGDAVPRLALQRLDGQPFDLASLRGHRVLLTFERSVDW